MMVREKSGYHHGNLRTALLEATLALIEERGLDSFTLREVARRAGVSHAAPYRHFKDKEALLSASAQEGFANLRTSISKAAAKEKKELEKFKVWGIAYVGFALRRPAHFQLMFGRELTPENHPEACAAADSLLEELINLVQKAQQQGLIRNGDPYQIARTGWSLSHGVAQLALSGQFVAKTQKATLVLVAQALDFLFQGLVTQNIEEDPHGKG